MSGERVSIKEILGVRIHAAHHVIKCGRMPAVKPRAALMSKTASSPTIMSAHLPLTLLLQQRLAVVWRRLGHHRHEAALTRSSPHAVRACAHSEE